MDEPDLLLRNLTYRLFVELGRAPSPDETAAGLGWEPSAVRDGWRRLHQAHALVLQDHVDEIRMANPFSAVPTAYRVRADNRWWFGNCAWDAFGILAALGVDGRIDCACPDCGDLITVEVTDQSPTDGSLVFHCLVPASHWWDEIAFT